MKIILNRFKDRPMLIALLTSSFALVLSLFFEAFSGKNPCRLCLYQRYEYLIIFLFSAIGSWIPKRFGLPLISIIFFLASFTGFYHFLIQIGHIKDPCIVQKISNMDSFVSMLENNSGCSRINMIFFIPVSILSSFYSLFFGIFFAIKLFEIAIKKLRLVSKKISL